MTPVIAIFDIGKTNKKLFLFDEHYKIVFEKTEQFAEIVDEDGDVCEDLKALTDWVLTEARAIFADPDFEIKAINFSAYGASFVHLGVDGKVVAPLYNYLKSFPQELLDNFYAKYGGELAFSMTTASPVLGNLNSGMQLYLIKNKKATIFEKIQHSLHLPQYLSHLISRQFYSDITSIGCHTNLWDFPQNTYHHWVAEEGILEKLAPTLSSNQVIETHFADKKFSVGIGLHDSSAALIPYLACFSEPFILISTGTWCISLNPFNNHPLTETELKQDSLCYISYKGDPVKASRLFAGNQHEIETKRLAVHFGKQADYYKTVFYDEPIINEIKENAPEEKFANTDLSVFKDYETAYHHLIYNIIQQQINSTNLVIKDENVKRIFVDGGFSKNPIYMNLLAQAFPQMEIFAASVAQATAVGAALAIHEHWNSKPLPSDIIDLKFYSNTIK